MVSQKDARPLQRRKSSVRTRPTPRPAGFAAVASLHHVGSKSRNPPGGSVRQLPSCPPARGHTPAESRRASLPRPASEPASYNSSRASRPRHCRSRSDDACRDTAGWYPLGLDQDRHPQGRRHERTSPARNQRLLAVTKESRKKGGRKPASLHLKQLHQEMQRCLRGNRAGRSAVAITQIGGISSSIIPPSPRAASLLSNP